MKEQARWMLATMPLLYIGALAALIVFTAGTFAIGVIL